MFHLGVKVRIPKQCCVKFMLSLVTIQQTLIVRLLFLALMSFESFSLDEIDQTYCMAHVTFEHQQISSITGTQV